MLRLVLLLIIVAGVAGYFTRPEEAAMREAAFPNLAENAATQLAVDRAYTNYYVAAKYDVSLDGQPVVSCWGAFTQVKCDRAADTRTGG
ncbi:MAG: hypothetical protein AB7Q23_15580 [Hyphomonadaceae bacterium]